MTLMVRLEGRKLALWLWVSGVVALMSGLEGKDSASRELGIECKVCGVEMRRFDGVIAKDA